MPVRALAKLIRRRKSTNASIPGCGLKRDLGRVTEALFVRGESPDASSDASESVVPDWGMLISLELSCVLCHSLTAAHPLFLLRQCTRTL